MVCVIDIFKLLDFVSFNILGGLISLVCFVCNMNLVRLSFKGFEFMFFFCVLLKYGNVSSFFFLLRMVM